MNDNKFGMFVHWGLYAALGVHEQVFARSRIDRDEYEGLMKTFNPVKYDPEGWVLLAKEAGMKYICFTTKHHDGFCMFDSQYTDYKITNTPYGKDVLKMLADACAKHGMLLSLYYSNPDWHYEYGYNPNSTHQWRVKNKEADTEKLRDYIKKQITELLTNYGPIYTLFWDIEPHIKDESINQLVRRLQPDILINDRGFDEGDFSTPERDYQTIPDFSRFTRMTEACNSVGEQSWGYRSNEDFYSIRSLTTSIDRIMSMGGSYLLNVGPKADGSIDDEYAGRIRRVGDWYNRMEGTLEDTETDTFAYNPIKRKCVVNKKNGKSYFNFYDGIPSSSVILENYPSAPQKVRLMNTGKALPFEVGMIPEHYDWEGGYSDKEVLRIHSIPIDELENEPIVIEITW